MLLNKKCIPCEVGGKPLSESDSNKLHEEIPDWKIEENKSLVRNFKFKDFASALKFVNRIGELAESEGHHPDLSFGWGYVRVTLTTHAVRGLSENDFIMAAKINKLS